jgi:hypothetical protein
MTENTRHSGIICLESDSSEFRFMGLACTNQIKGTYLINAQFLMQHIWLQADA